MVVYHLISALQSNQTWQALYSRSDPPKRPFVLTRSFFAGSQRFGAMWTGDNLGTWEHMEVGLKMVLANSLGGFSFAGGKYAESVLDWGWLIWAQLTWADFLATLRPRCSFAGTSSGSSSRSSGRTHTSIQRGGNLTSLTSLTRALSVMSFVFDTRCFPFGTRLSMRRVSLALPSSGV